MRSGGARLRASPRRRRRCRRSLPTCAVPETLGTGVKTGAVFCFVLAGRDPAQGVLVTIPPHTGPATLLFDIHNRHTYSEEDIRAGRGFAKYTAVIGVLTLKGELLSRGAVQSRVPDGEGSATTASPAARARAASRPSRRSAAKRCRSPFRPGVDQVSLLGEVLDATTAAGRETATPGRTVAIISNVRVEFRPAPPAVKR